MAGLDPEAMDKRVGHARRESVHEESEVVTVQKLVDQLAALEILYRRIQSRSCYVQQW